MQNSGEQSLPEQIGSTCLRLISFDGRDIASGFTDLRSPPPDLPETDIRTPILTAPGRLKVIKPLSSIITTSD